MARVTANHTEPEAVGAQERLSFRARMMKVRPTAITAAGMFPVFVLGMVLMMAAMPLILAGVMGVFGAIGSGWTGRALGVVGAMAGSGLFWLGSRLTKDFGPW